MDRIVDHLFVFEGDGMIRDFPGNYASYREEEETKPQASKPETNPVEKPIQPEIPASKKKVGFKEKREFELLEKELQDLNKEKQMLTDQLSSGSMDYLSLEKASHRIKEITALLDEKEMRWLELSELMS